MQERPAGALYCGRGASGNEYHRADRRFLPDTEIPAKTGSPSAGSHSRVIELSYILEDCYTNYHLKKKL